MNRLILVGNGFDLAHNMKTSYLDFILDYVNSCFERANTSGKYTDELITVSRICESASIPSEAKSSIEYFIQFIIENDLGIYSSGENRNASRDFKLKIKHSFFRHLITGCSSYKWINIENEYYNFLKQTLKNLISSERKEKIEHLNETMANLILLLKGYYQNLNKPTEIKKFQSLFKQPFEKTDFCKNFMFNREKLPEQTLVVNFNYTSTVEQYLDGSQVLIHIHGKSRDNSSPIIFGFGDEMDVDYQEIERATERGFLRYIKSFGYFQSLSYFSLIRFIDSDDFQVFILGHSCGLSDRTMLNMIFEHENCKSIKIFYHQNRDTDNYRELTEEISRHFRNKQSMRTKIVPKSNCIAMPQFSKSE